MIRLVNAGMMMVVLMMLVVVAMLQDVVDSHPGLTFLQDAPEFHSRYVQTVHFSVSPFESAHCITSC